MSRPVFLADNNLRESIVVGVGRREPAIGFTRVRQHGLRTAPDEQILAFAPENGLIVVTHDVNTMTRHAYERVRLGLPMPGLIAVGQEMRVGQAVQNLVMIWAASEAEEWPNRMVYLPL